MDVDLPAARELHLFINNDYPLYKTKLLVYRSLARKKDKDRYDPKLAPKAFMPLVTAAAKKYMREFGAPGDRWNAIFCPIARRHAALALVDEFSEWYDTDYQAEKK